METHRLRILHLSDLHERVAPDWMDEERKARVARGAYRRHRVLEEESFWEALEEAASRPVDLRLIEEYRRGEGKAGFGYGEWKEKHGL